MGLFGKKTDAVDQTYVNASAMEQGDVPVAQAVLTSTTEPAQYAPPPSQHMQKKGDPNGNEKVMVQPVQPVVQPGQQVTQIPGPVSTAGVPFLRRKPVTLNMCPACGAQTTTRIRTWPNIMTWVAVASLLLLFWPLFWIPFVFDSCKQTDHFCMACDSKIGSAYPMQDCCEKHRS